MKIAKERLRANDHSPEGLKHMIALEAYFETTDIGHTLKHLVKMRVSQINGCAYCLKMHATDARAKGESEDRLYLLSAWHESSLYTPRERAALAWAESLTLISENHAPDAVYQELAAHFTPKEMTDLTLVITQINAWNRLAIGFRYNHAV